MPHPENQLKTVKLRLSTSPAIMAYLKRLVGTGLYGRHHTDAAERLIAQGIEALIERGIIEALGPDQE